MQTIMTITFKTTLAENYNKTTLFTLADEAMTHNTLLCPCFSPYIYPTIDYGKKTLTVLLPLYHNNCFLLRQAKFAISV